MCWCSWVVPPFELFGESVVNEVEPASAVVLMSPCSGEVFR
jgi:hypothetical protein